MWLFEFLSICILQRVYWNKSEDKGSIHRGLSVYHQIQVWEGLRNTDFTPLRWGWQILNDRFAPIMTDVAAGPPELLKVMRCVQVYRVYRAMWKQLFLQEAGLTGASACKVCHGINCANVPESENTDFEWNFMDAFELN